jgi:glycosyltransferase involved in cell wall biosynthesis
MRTADPLDGGSGLAEERRPLHVLMTADAVGGVWVFATTLAQGLCRRGAYVTIVTLGPPPSDEQLWALNGVEHLDFVVTDLALEGMEPEGLDVPRAHFRLAALAKRLQPDIVHLNGYRQACMRWDAPVLITAHTCVRSWQLAVRGAEPAEARWENYRANVEAGLSLAEAWTAPTKAFRHEIETLYAPRTQGRVIYNGVEAFPPAPTKEPFILSAGRLWDEAKNVKLLAGIAGDLDWPMRIAGASHFPGTAEIGQLPSTAERIGDLYRPRLLDQMSRAAIFASCPLYEPFGLTVLEAASSGCALVLSDIPSFRELWQDAALFADPRDANAFRDALRKVCDDAALRDRLQRAAIDRAKSYSVAAMVDAYWAVYQDLARGAAQAPADATSTAPAPA